MARVSVERVDNETFRGNLLSVWERYGLWPSCAPMEPQDLCDLKTQLAYAFSRDDLEQAVIVASRFGFSRERVQAEWFRMERRYR